MLALIKQINNIFQEAIDDVRKEETFPISKSSLDYMKEKQRKEIIEINSRRGRIA